MPSAKSGGSATLIRRCRHRIQPRLGRPVFTMMAPLVRDCNRSLLGNQRSGEPPRLLFLPALWTWILYTATDQRELQASGSLSTKCRSQSGSRLCSVSWALTVYTVAVEPATMAHACDMVWHTPYRTSESPCRS